MHQHKSLACAFSKTLLALALSSVFIAAEAAGTDTVSTTADSQEPVEQAKKQRPKLGSEAHAEMLPRWEVGLGGLQVYGKDYPASDNDNERLLVLPYAIYRGEKFRIGDGGISAMAFENSRFSLDFSVAGSFNADSEDNPLRDGLPDIDYMFEMGPQLVVTLLDRINNDGTRSEMTFSTQLRAAFSTDLSDVKGRGGVLTTVLEWERGGFMNGRMGLFAEIGPKWASKELQEVFYEVEPQYATDTRPAYEATGGYIGTDTSFGISFEATPNITLFGAVGKKFYSGAANEDSPLFETDNSDMVWLGALWQIKTSKELVAVLRD